MAMPENADGPVATPPSRESVIAEMIQTSPPPAAMPENADGPASTPPSPESVIAEMIQTSLAGFRSCNFTFPASGLGTEKECDDALDAFGTFYHAMSRLHCAAKKGAPAEHPVLREQIRDTEVPQIYQFLASTWRARRPSQSRASFAHAHMQALSRRYAEAPREGAWPGDAPAAATTTTDLRVEVLSAHDLGSPEYRLGDRTRSAARSLLYGRKNRLEAVYATVRLGAGGPTVRTPLASCPGDSEHPSVHFSKDRHYFSYSDEKELTVEVFDKRDVQAALRGDPKVGYGTFALGQDAAPDGQPHTAEVPLVSGDASVGKVLLRYRLIATTHTTG